MSTAGSLTPVSRSIVAALTGLSLVGASTTVGNAAAPPRATFPRLAVPALPGFCNVRSFRVDEHTRHPERAALSAISVCSATPWASGVACQPYPETGPDPAHLQ